MGKHTMWKRCIMVAMNKIFALETSFQSLLIDQMAQGMKECNISAWETISLEDNSDEDIESCFG